MESNQEHDLNAGGRSTETQEIGSGDESRGMFATEEIAAAPEIHSAAESRMQEEHVVQQQTEKYAPRVESETHGDPAIENIEAMNKEHIEDQIASDSIAAAALLFGHSASLETATYQPDIASDPTQPLYSLQSMPATVSHHEQSIQAMMANLPVPENYSLPSTSTQFRRRPGEELTAPPLALESTPSLPVPLSDPMVIDAPFHDPTPVIHEAEAPRIQAFAKLEFDDGQFYMNTYSVILGRDIRAARLAHQKDKDEREKGGEGLVNGQSTSGGDASHTPVRTKRDGSMKMAGSVVSESGGIIGMDEGDGSRRKKSKKGSKKSKSTSSSSRHVSRKNSIIQPAGHTDYQALAQSSTSDGAHPVNPSSLLPSPDECPLIPIHPPAVTTGTGSHKGISRKHVKIAYNFDKHIFEVEIKGKNGAFVDDQWHAPGEVRPLKSGSFIQIGGVGVRFLLPEVAVDNGSEPELDEHGGKEMSFAFEDDRGVEMEGSSELDDDEDENMESGDEEEGDEDEEEEGEDGDEEEEEAEESPSPEPVAPPVPVRRGPGRPPKNGISKRARELAEKEAKAKAAGKAAKLKSKEKVKITIPPVTKNKVGRPRKNSRPETPPPKPEKRKYTKRKVVEPSSPSKIKKEKESKEPKPPKEKKEKKPPKPPRSPSPVFDESKLTAEELQKPQASYVVLIHEALTNSKTGAMSLPQIYRAIERKYPFYKLRVQTTGWQSSVRHNLSQHHAFQKVERDGKGWLWGIVPGVSIEKERKKRLSPPPPPPHQPLQQPISRMPHIQQPMMPAPPGLGNAHLGYHGPPMHQMPPHGPPGAGLGKGPPPQAGLPRGPNGVLPPNANAQGATFVNSNPSAAYSPRQLLPPQSLSGKNVGPGYHQPHENRPPHPPPQNVSAPPSRPPPSVAALSQTQQAQPLQAQHRGLKLKDETLQAVTQFQDALITTLAAQGKKHAEAMVKSAVSRALGITDKSTVPGKEDPQEIQLVSIISNMINKSNNKPSGSSASSSANANAGRTENKTSPMQQRTLQHQQTRPPPAQYHNHQQSPNHPPGRPVGGGSAHQQQPPSSGSRQGGHGVQAQILGILSNALLQNDKLSSPQPRGAGRPVSAGSSSSVGGPPRPGVNGTARSSGPDSGSSPSLPAVAASTGGKSVSPTISRALQQPSQPVAGVKRPLENGDGSQEGQPEAKKVAIEEKQEA